MPGTPRIVHHRAAMDRPPTLRIAAPEDAQAIQRLMHASASAIFPAYYDAAQAASAVRWVAQPDPALLGDGTYFILEVESDAVACGGWSRRAKPYMGSAAGADDDRLLDPATEPAHVRAMFVHPAWTRRGLGRRILEACEDAARAAGFTRLELVATLPGAPLYRAFGFVDEAEELVVLADGVELPCLAMTKDIAPTSPRAHAEH
jgi:GNAT superfamily N-acetyltransferase